ncbi:hypothetical protein [Aeoliella sp. SH292]|uniref:hypothetical protein n=1 Tax=Aeoliella sp. SH292 TaxID=3454464 RepID=UPI003F99B858
MKSLLLAVVGLVAITGLALAIEVAQTPDTQTPDTKPAVVAAEEALPPAPVVKCTDAKCEACEAGTCTDPKCPAKCCEDAANVATAVVKCEACENGTCDAENCPLKAAAAAVVAEGGQPVISSTETEAELATPTHKQTKIIAANQEGLPNTTVNCFTMTRDGRLLAGCGTSDKDGQVRVFDADGEYVETWSTPVQVEAINIRSTDGMVFVAGGGRLVKLDESGNLVANEPSPHATVTKEQAAKMREAVIVQMKSQAEMYKRQAKIYEQQIELIGGQIEKLQTTLAELPADESADEESEDDRTRKMLETQITQLERSKTSLERTQKLWNERIAQMDDAEPSDEEIQAQLDSQIARKLGVASISAVGDTVFVACPSSVGYGYSVWKIDEEFKAGEEIVADLSGCCGQMDVQANDQGIYVAENSKHRVVCFNYEGDEVTHWGESDRDGYRGFGSCCNPMNVAFGPESTVYTAESGTGRIKQYSSKGELLQVVGTADLVPGCKKVSIGATSDGSRVFMLDITRNHIVMMERIPEEERAEMVAKTKAGEVPANAADEAATTTTSTTMRAISAPLRVLMSPLQKKAEAE